MRRFGIHESDLAIDLTHGNEAVLVTRILEHCAGESGEGARPDLFRGLTVGRRLERLLTLAAESDAQLSAFTFPFHCTGCGEHNEFELTLAEIREQQDRADAIEAVAVEYAGESFVFRKPCGRDQEAWGAAGFAGPAEAMQAIVRTLALRPEAASNLDARLIELVDEALHEADPLVNFRCRIACAECALPNEFDIDLCAVALNMLRQLQRQLVLSVHRLASRYHWSEREIFAVPHWRRKEYLELIAAGVAP
jgi:hypothetical protein